MYELILPSIFAALLGYLGSVLNTFLSRKKEKAETESILTDIDDKNTKIQRELQDQIIGLIEQNQKLFTDMLSERKASGEERDENLKAQLRISKDIVNLGNDLRNINESLSAERRRSVNLEDEVIKYKKVSTDYIVKIGTLEQQLAKHDVAIDAIKKVTGSLPERIGVQK